MERNISGRLVITILLCMVVATAVAQQDFRSSRLRQGDLLFHVVTQSNAITDVTPGMIDHVAIYLGTDSVIEAVGKGVVITPLDSLLAQDGHYLVGHVRHLDRRQSISNARQYIGRPYDWLFLPDNDDIYCSELVEQSYVDRHGRKLFHTIPMSFHDDTGRITDYWKRFYAKHQMEVPEGQPGTNPGELSRRSNVQLFGKLTK